MSTVNFFLKDSKAKKTAITALIVDGRNYRKKVYTGISINPKHWSKNRKRVLSSEPKAVAYNNDLDRIGGLLEDSYRKAKREGIEATTEYFKSVLEPARVRVLSSWEIYDEFLEAKKSIPSSYEKYVTLKKYLNDFEKFRRKKLLINDFDHIVLEEFQNYFLNHTELKNGSIKRYFGFLKSFLNWSLSRAYLENRNFQLFKPISQPDTLKIILTDEEIQKIIDTDLGEKKYLANVRELLILSCDTGLRFSDYTRIDIQHIKKDEDGDLNLALRNKKTNHLIWLPLLTKRSEKIVERIIDGEIRPISNQKMNDYVKELGMLCGIDEPFEIDSFKGKKTISEVKPKYELMSTHIGRRTFATKYYLQEVPAEIIMHYTGHKDYKSFLQYINIPKRSYKNLMKKATADIPIMKVSKKLAIR
ncbi:tyrosine-type recombinase/integrase [Ekhidna sp.]